MQCISDSESSTVGDDLESNSVLTRQVAATISVREHDNDIPKYYMLGIDMSPVAERYNEARCLPYPKLEYNIRFPQRRQHCRLHIHAVLFDCDDIYRPTCLVPVGGVMETPKKLHLTRVGQAKPSPFWAFSLPYMDRNLWACYTAEELQEQNECLQQHDRINRPLPQEIVANHFDVAEFSLAQEAADLLDDLDAGFADDVVEEDDEAGDDDDDA